ncbi:MAG: transposase [Bryobacterales bacterium]
MALLRTIPGVGVMTALTWAVEIGELARFRTLNGVVSYCGLCARLDESAGKASVGRCRSATSICSAC